jgi:hypothetical protein
MDGVTHSMSLVNSIDSFCMTDEEMPPMPVPMIPIAISRGVTWTALFDQVEASRGIGRDWLPGTTSICGVRRALVQILFQPGCRQV